MASMSSTAIDNLLEVCETVIDNSFAGSRLRLESAVAAVRAEQLKHLTDDAIFAWGNRHGVYGLAADRRCAVEDARRL